MPRASSDRLSIFDWEAPSSIQQGAPVNGTWYPVHDIDVPHRVKLAVFSILDTGETLELELTISGNAPIVIVAAALADAINKVFENEGPQNVTEFTVEDFNSEHRVSYLFDCHSLLVRVRKTTANGVGDLNAKIQWGRLEAVAL